MRISLFIKVFVLIIIVTSVVLAISFHYITVSQENNLLKNLDINSRQLSNAIKGSLYHAMLGGKQDEIKDIIDTVSREEGIKQVFILDRHGRIVFSPFKGEVGKVLDKKDPTCVICHKGSPKAETKTILYKTPEGEKVFRNVNPIYSSPVCHKCHDPNEKIRGIIITDMPVTRIEEEIASNVRKMFMVGFVVFIALGSILFVSLSKMILAPLKILVSGTKKISSGDLAYKIPLEKNDEMGVLVSSFNSMTDSLRQSREELLKTIEDIRQRNEELTILYKMIQEITSTIEMDRLKEVVLNLIFEALAVEECYLLTFNYKMNTGLMSLKNRNSPEIFSSKVEFSFNFNDNLDQETFFASTELKEKLPFYEKIISLPSYYEEENEVISLPLQSRESLIGIISARKGDNKKFSKTQTRIFNSLAKSLSLSIQNSLLYELVITDGLTGLFSKSHFERMLEIEVERAKRSNTPLSLIILDIDEFKSINDKYGHQVGDMALIKLSLSIKLSFRSIDILCRFGGDEFTIILPNTDSLGTLHAAQRIVWNLKKFPVIFGKEEEKFQLDISIGYATYPGDANNSKELLQRADDALYKAKRLGKNKIVACGKVEW
ncbi:MAG: hypothetical protein A2149_04980 [Candidatus Schekmanbacteria bacterium RBG_16_38_11]|uniref:Diguanylate cyclase n=1 Tax=Candidatus Schekmanbacteria bacterium RBG_16_38_11 TaxID=1817880 RepID=A0A1F7RZY4_9BACT|nr:MAG: hypothetical protein A2149_04980 [Candidatus Schekmanbacteria bacterium RBG_16_38_11]